MLSSVLYEWDVFDNLMRDAFKAVPVSVSQSEAGYGYELDMPGVPEDSIEATLENGILTVKGERNGRSMIRSIALPKGVDSDRLEAQYENGVLRIAVPFSEAAKPKRIEIASNRPKQIE